MMDEREVLALNEDADYEALAVPRIAKFGGGALLFLGVMTLVLCLQTLLMFRVTLVTTPIFAVMLLLGVGCAVLGVRITRADGKAAIGGTFIAAFTSLLSGAWFAYGWVHDTVIALAAALIPIALLALVLCALSIDAARQADRARARLRQQGLNLGQ
jgi:hypothetical protein